MRQWRPNLGDYVALSDETVRTEYLKRKAARLAGGKVDGIASVIYRAHLSTKTTQVFTVRGDSGAIYTVNVLPHTDPWMAACSRGGVHDMQPEGEACSHGVAAAAVWQLLTEHEEVPA